MALKEYINSGNLEQYCLDMFNQDNASEVMAMAKLYPEVQEELDDIELALEQLALSHAVQPRSNLRNRILSALDMPGESLDLNNLPPTSKYSNYQAWLAAVEHLIPTEPFDDFFAHVLTQNEHIQQTLVVTKLNVPEETHEQVAESFFILKGQCVCTVGDDTYTLNAGDHLNIPLYTNHDIEITSPYVIAILQHQFA